jgi:hypothetical protein
VSRPVQIAAFISLKLSKLGLIFGSWPIGLRLRLGPDSLVLLLSINIIEAGHTIFSFRHVIKI